jgi:hypothetical protein
LSSEDGSVLARISISGRIMCKRGIIALPNGPEMQQTFGGVNR